MHWEIERRIMSEREEVEIEQEREHKKMTSEREESRRSTQKERKWGELSLICHVICKDLRMKERG